LEQFRFVRSI